MKHTNEQVEAALAFAERGENPSRHTSGLHAEILAAAFRRLREEATAKDALLGDLRDELINLRESIAKEGWELEPSAALARTPEDAGAEVAKHRKDLADAAGELLLPIPEPGTPMAKMMRANRLMRDERDALRTQLATAEARAKDLGEKCDEWTRLYAEQSARLRAMTEAGEELRAKLITGTRNWMEQTAPEKLAAVDAWDAAKTSDLPPHPDTVRLDWLEADSERGANTVEHWPASERGHVYANKQWEDGPTPGSRLAKWDHFKAPTVRAAIDAAMKGAK